MGVASHSEQEFADAAWRTICRVISRYSYVFIPVIATNEVCQLNYSVIATFLFLHFTMEQGKGALSISSPSSRCPYVVDGFDVSY